VRPELSSAAVPAARRNRAKMCSALDMERVWEGDPVLPALGSSSGDGACEALCVPAVLAARRNRVKMCSALDTEDDLVLPARCSVKPCSNIDQDDDEAPVPQRQMRKPRQTSQSPARASTSMKSPVRVEVSTSQSRAASPVRRGARSGPGTGAGVRVGSPVRVGQRGGTSPRRSPTRSRPVKIAGPLTKPEQRAALLRQRREKQTLLEMLQRDLEREAPAAAHAWLEAGAHDGFRPDLVHRDETVHRGVVCGVGGANCWSGRADRWHVMRDEPVHGGVKCGRETQQREWNELDAAAPDALADEQAALFLALTLDASDSTCCRNGWSGSRRVVSAGDSGQSHADSHVTVRVGRACLGTAR
jgi:hypothetical protein